MFAAALDPSFSVPCRPVPLLRRSGRPGKPQDGRSNDRLPPPFFSIGVPRCALPGVAGFDAAAPSSALAVLLPPSRGVPGRFWPRPWSPCPLGPGSPLVALVNDLDDLRREEEAVPDHRPGWGVADRSEAVIVNPSLARAMAWVPIPQATSRMDRASALQRSWTMRASGPAARSADPRPGRSDASDRPSDRRNPPSKRPRP